MDLLDSMQSQGQSEQLHSARTELAAAKEQNAALKNKIHTLNASINSLTSENSSLQAEVAAIRKFLSLSPPSASSSSSAPSTTLAPLFPPSPPTSLTLSTTIPGPSKSNITAVASTATLTFTAHSDRTVHSITHGLYTSNGDLLPTRSTVPPTSLLGTLSAPVVAMEIIASKLFAACLDGKVYSYKIGAESSSSSFEEFPIKHGQRITNLVEFQGKVLTTDTGGIIKVCHPTPSSPSHSSIITWRLETPVIAVCATCPSSPSDPTYLYVYADGVHVHRYTIPEDGGDLGNADLICMNKGGDTHRSYRILHMSLSPDSSHLACQTDRGRITVWSGAGGDDPSEVKEVRSLYGHQGDDFFIGRVAWDKTSTRIISNSHDNSIYVYSPLTGEAKQKISSQGGGHAAKIRDMKVDFDGDTLTTVGWDGKAKIWVWI